MSIRIRANNYTPLTVFQFDNSSLLRKIDQDLSKDEDVNFNNVTVANTVDADTISTQTLSLNNLTASNYIQTDVVRAQTSAGVEIQDHNQNTVIQLQGAGIISSKDIDFQDSHSIVNLPSPNNDGDAANKSYVDNVVLNSGDNIIKLSSPGSSPQTITPSQTYIEFQEYTALYTSYFSAQPAMTTALAYDNDVHILEYEGSPIITDASSIDAYSVLIAPPLSDNIDTITDAAYSTGNTIYDIEHAPTRDKIWILDDANTIRQYSITPGGSISNMTDDNISIDLSSAVSSSYDFHSFTVTNDYQTIYLGNNNQDVYIAYLNWGDDIDQLTYNGDSFNTGGTDTIESLSVDPTSTILLVSIGSVHDIHSIPQDRSTTSDYFLFNSYSTGPLIRAMHPSGEYVMTDYYNSSNHWGTLSDFALGGKSESSISRSIGEAICFARDGTKMWFIDDNQNTDDISELNFKIPSTDHYLKYEDIK